MKYILLSLVLLLNACGHTPEKEIVTNYVFVDVTCEELGKIAPIKTLPVEFVNGTDRKGNEVLGLRGDQYSNLSINSRRTIVYIVEQAKTINYYKACIENHNSTGLPNEERVPD